MGDPKRGKEIASYIKKNFNPNLSILSIADGNLILAKELYHNYKVTVYDPDIRNNNRNVKSKIKIIGKIFTSDCKSKCDLIIGVHPDEATGEIIDYAIKNNTSCILIPCCVKGKYSSQCQNKHRWVKFLANILIQNGFRTSINYLPITGDKLLIKAIPNKKK